MKSQTSSYQNDDLCITMKELLDNNYIFILYFIKGILCAIGIISTISLAYHKLLTWIGHINGRILFIVHCFYTILLPISHLTLYLYDYYRRLMYKETPCEGLITVRLSAHLKSPFLSSTLGQSTSMFVIAVERAISTYDPQQYEKIRKPYISIILSILTIFITYYIPYEYIFSRLINLDHNTVIITARTPQTENELTVLTILNIAFEAGFIFLFTFAFYKTQNNKLHLQKVANSFALGSKYQMNETQNVIKKLLPLCCIHFILMFLNGLCLFIIMLVKTMDKITFVLVLELVNLTFLYSIIMPSILIYQSKKEKKEREAIIVRNVHQDDYFNSLKNIFNKQP